MTSTKIILTAVLSLAIFNPISALAEDATVTPSVTPTVTPTITLTPTPTSKGSLIRQWIKNRKEEREEEKEDEREDRDELKELKKGLKPSVTGSKQALKATSAQARKNAHSLKILNSQNGLLNSFTVRARNLERYKQLILDKIADRLAKFPGNAALTAAQTKLNSNDYKNLWINYNNDLTVYKTAITTVSTSSDPKSLLPDLKTKAKKVNQDLKDIRSFLVEVLRTVVKAK